MVQQYFGADGAWYLIVLGAACVPAAVWLPRGLWGSAARRTPIRLFPLARRVTEADMPPTRRATLPLAGR